MAQKNQMGVAAVISRVQAGADVLPASTGTGPELKPSAPVVALRRRVHGFAKDDCVTVCCLGCGSEREGSASLLAFHPLHRSLTW